MAKSRIDHLYDEPGPCKSTASLHSGKGGLLRLEAREGNSHDDRETTNAAKIDPVQSVFSSRVPWALAGSDSAIAAANQGVDFSGPWIISTTKVPGTGTGWVGILALAGTAASTARWKVEPMRGSIERHGAGASVRDQSLRGDVTISISSRTMLSVPRRLS